MPRPDRTDPDPGPVVSSGPAATDATPGPTPRTLTRPPRAVADFRPYPTSPTRTRRSPASAAAGRAAPRSSATPATVWLTPPTSDTDTDAAEATPSQGPGEGWQVGVLARVVTSFSSVGAAVMVLPWPDLGSGRPDPDLDPVRSERPGPGTVAATVVRLGRVPIATPIRPRSVPPRSSDDAPAAAGASPREATLLITAMPSHVTGSSAAVDEIAHRAAAALRIGGILAVLTHCDWSDGTLWDPTGPMVTAAQNADLLYLQHIIAIHLPARDLRLHRPAHDRTPAVGGRHRRVHSDVLVFAQPQDRQDQPGRCEQPEPDDHRTEGRP